VRVSLYRQLCLSAAAVAASPRCCDDVVFDNLAVLLVSVADVVHWTARLGIIIIHSYTRVVFRAAPSSFAFRHWSTHYTLLFISSQHGRLSSIQPLLLLHCASHPEGVADRLRREVRLSLPDAAEMRTPRAVDVPVIGKSVNR
jgi:hypothetical protein